MEKERKYYTNEEKLSLVRRIFFDLFFSMQRDYKRICKRDRLRLLIKWRINKKKFFSFFTLTPSHMWLKRPVYRGFSGEGKCEGKLSPLTLALTPSWISLAVIRPVSLRLQNEGQKKLTDCSDAHGVFDHGFFLTFSFRCKGVLNGFASVTACGCRDRDYPISYPW